VGFVLVDDTAIDSPISDSIHHRFIAIFIKSPSEEEREETGADYFDGGYGEGGTGSQTIVFGTRFASGECLATKWRGMLMASV